MSDTKSLNRREFFSYVTVGWVMFSAACAGLASMAFRFSYPNVNFDPEMEFLAGTPGDYAAGVDERYKNAFGVWMVKMDGRLVALSNICTHLGCIPTWLPAEFFCVRNSSTQNALHLQTHHPCRLILKAGPAQRSSAPFSLVRSSLRTQHLIRA